MAVIDRHRVARLVELSAAERTLKGPERMLREEDVKLLVRAAYDDAADAARAEFMARVEKMPTSAWPWSAVQAMAPRGGGGLGAVVSGPKPPMTPALLVLIRGQADSADIDPGNRIPDRGSLEAAEWESLYKALETWDTTTITQAIGPQGWVSVLGTTSGQVPKDTGDGATSGAPAQDVTPGAPTGEVPSTSSSEVPAPQTPAPSTAITWQRPAALAAGAVVVVAAGVAVYSLGQSRSRRELEDMLERLEEQS